MPLDINDVIEKFMMVNRLFNIPMRLDPGSAVLFNQLVDNIRARFDTTNWSDFHERFLVRRVKDRLRNTRLKLLKTGVLVKVGRDDYRLRSEVGEVMPNKFVARMREYMRKAFNESPEEAVRASMEELDAFMASQGEMKDQNMSD